MMMLSNYFIKFAARVVLASYITQTLAPVVYACEVETRPESFGNALTPGESKPSEKLFIPLDQDLAKANTSIRNKEASPEASPRLPTPFQYRLKVKALKDSAENFKLKLSRKNKESEDRFENLYAAKFKDGVFSNKFEQAPKVAPDDFVALFKGASVHKFFESGTFAAYTWDFQDLGSLTLQKDGRFAITQDGAIPFLSSYDLIVKTSQNLVIDSLKVAQLTIQAPETHFVGDVHVDHLHMDHTVINEGVAFDEWGAVKAGGLHVQQITGQGRLINQGTLDLIGSTEKPAILGVREVAIKNKNTPEAAKMTATHLQVTSDNHAIQISKGASLTVKETLAAAASANVTKEPSFVNIGIVKLGTAFLACKGHACV
jgi:hypothetical protein